ncbi:MAG: carbohydrate ABC transporter permease [Chloroflexota bacterium]
MDNPTSVAVARPRARALTRVNISKVILYAILTLAALAFLMPFYWTVTSSVKVTSEVRQVPPTWWPHSFTLDHYRRVLWRPTFFRYMLNSLIYAGGTAGIVLITSTLIGFAMEKFPSRLGGILFALIIATMMVPMDTYIISLFLLLVGIQRTFHIPMINTYWGMMMPWICYPMGIFMMRTAMKSVPNEMLEAARMDGASTLGIYWRIVLPLISTSMATLAVIVFLWKYDDLLWPLIVASTSNMFPIPVGLLEFTGVYWIDYDLYIAAATLAMAPIFLIYFTTQRFIVQGIATTGLKG